MISKTPRTIAQKAISDNSAMAVSPGIKNVTSPAAALTRPLSNVAHHRSRSPYSLMPTMIAAMPSTSA